ncbi:MAG: tetratricopeptide repeat protein, partial [bacterium]
EETSEDAGFDSSEFAAELRENMEPEIPDTFREFESSGFEESNFKEQPEEQAQPRTKSLRKKHGDKIVTPTLGEIYAAQGQFAKAIDVFETLRKKHPDNDFYLKKIDLLKRKLAEARDA